jgi:hypothetical protein
MSSDISNLEVHVPLGNLQSKNISQYINVSQYKKLSIAFFSDTELTLTFTSSHDSVKDGLSYVFSTTPNSWGTATLQIILPYIKLDYEKMNPNQPNNELIVICTGQLRRGYTKNVEVVDDHRHSQKRRWSSIIRSPLSKGKEEIACSSSSSPVQPPLPSPNPPPQDLNVVSQKEFPSLILPNTLFVGGKGNKILALPPGTPGQILQFTEYGIKWV